MALVVKDRVKQTTTTTGTGNIVLNGNIDGFQTFAAALTNGDTTYYGIFVPSTNAFEVGLGTWTEGSATLARTTILESSNSGSAINITAQAEVFITQPAEKAVFQDANGDVDLGGNKILFGNLYSSTGDLPSASTYHGMFAHVHGTGKAYYAHGGNWIELVNEDTSGNVSMGGNLTVTGDLTVNGTTTTVSTTNTVVKDSLIELGNGTSGSPSNDAGIVIERGSSDNAFIGYDESADKFTVGTGSFTGATTGNLTISTGTLVANVEGNVTGNVTGNVSGSSGSTTGNAATATALATARNIGGVSFDGTGNINLPGVNTSGNQDTSGNAATATTAGTVTTAAQTNITSVGTLTTLTVDDITINGSTISDGGDLTFDVGGDIILDSDAANWRFKDAGTSILEISSVSSGPAFYSAVSNADMLFKGNDGGSAITALTLDMSAAGEATFNDDINLGDSKRFRMGAGGDFEIFHDGSNNYIKGASSDQDIIFQGVDGGSGITALTLDMSDAGTAIFNHDIKLADNGQLIIGSGSDANIRHDGSNTKFSHTGSGGLYIGADTLGLQNGANNENYLTASANGAVYIYYNGSSKLNTTSGGVNIEGELSVDNIYVADKIYHEGDTDTYVEFATNTINLYTGGTQAHFQDSGLFLYDGSLAEDYDALSGTSPTCNVDNGGAFSLTMSGNTTFTFSGAASGFIQGFVLQLTGNGSTVTWPGSVKWAGGTAPDAPANGETDILVFHTRDGGTNWYGVLASDAAA